MAKKKVIDWGKQHSWLKPTPSKKAPKPQEKEGWLLPKEVLAIIIENMMGWKSTEKISKAEWKKLEMEITDRLAWEQAEYCDLLNNQSKTCADQIAEAKKELLQTQCQQKFKSFKEIIQEERAKVIKEIEKLVGKEMLIAHTEGQPTSRLTSLAVKLSKIK